MDDFYRSTEKDLEQIGKIDDGGHPGFPKFVIWGVILFCCLVFIVLILQLRSNVTLKIPQIGGKDISELDLDNGLSILELEDEQLRQQDTDKDGLSDYDELRIYGTNAFIADSDSDGLSDKIEIDQGKDPNCPEGETCFGSEGGDTITKEISPFATPEIESLTRDPEAIKELLIERGVNPILVNELDDQTLQVLAKEAFDALTNVTPEKLDLLENLTPDQIRTVLLYGGVEQQVLDGLSDEELERLYRESLSIQTAEGSTNN